MHPNDKWQKILAPLLEGTVYELIGVEHSMGKNARIRIFLDKPGGITIEEIAYLSKKINILLGVEELVQKPYALEVSSPGMDRPLFLPKHFQAQLGKMISVKIQHSIDNRVNFKGILRQATDNNISMEIEGKMFFFDYVDIDKANVMSESGTSRK
jgi:ribosome maturation factor RimP